jgi:CDP-4-dehydro-6-deoxyglucose reductase
MPDVTILPDGTRTTANPEETLIRALGRAGLRYRVGCKRGGCGICKVRLVLGEVRYERPIAASVLTDDERVEGICLSCRAVPITNIIIELQEGDRLRRVLGFAYQNTAVKVIPAAMQAGAIVVNESSEDERKGTEDR